MSDEILSALIGVVALIILALIGGVVKLASKVLATEKDVERIQTILEHHDSADTRVRSKLDDLRVRVDDGFSSTDEVLTGLLETLAGLRGELRGSGTIHKKMEE